MTINRKAIELWREECAENRPMRVMIFPDEWRQLCDLALKALRPEEGAFTKIGALHRPMYGDLHFEQLVFSIPLAVHGSIDVYMRATREPQSSAAPDPREDSKPALDDGVKKMQESLR